MALECVREVFSCIKRRIFKISPWTIKKFTFRKVLTVERLAKGISFGKNT